MPGRGHGNGMRRVGGRRGRGNPRGPWGRGGAGRGRPSGAGIRPLPAGGGAKAEDGTARGGALAGWGGSGGAAGLSGAERNRERSRRAMEASRGRGGLAALWCLGLLGGLARVAGTHYRYLWRSCYPCYLGQAGYPVGTGDGSQRPGGRGGLDAGRRDGETGPAPRALCFLLLSLRPGAAASAAGGSGAGTGREAAPAAGTRPRVPSRRTFPFLASLAAGAADSRACFDQTEEKHPPAFAGGHRACTAPWHWQLWGSREAPRGPGAGSPLTGSAEPGPLGGVCGCGSCPPSLWLGSLASPGGCRVSWEDHGSGCSPVLGLSCLSLQIWYPHWAGLPGGSSLERPGGSMEFGVWQPQECEVGCGVP